MKKKLLAGIIGSGLAASFHYEAVKKIYSVEAEVIGVYSKTRDHRERFAAQRGIKAFNSMEKLIESSDVVHICTPVSTHESIAVMVLERDKFPVVEKPLTGFCGDGTENFRGDTFPKRGVLEAVHSSINRILATERESKAKILYAENWIYAPAIQKEREIIERTGAQILWIHAEQSHSGSHAAANGFWESAGGGVMLGNGCHPVTAALYLKRKEGLSRGKDPIRPSFVSARIHAVTQLQSYLNQDHLRSDYFDIEDFSQLHIDFEDGTIADIFASGIIMGGTHNRLEVAANNHRSICNINPNTAMQTYNPCEEYFQDIYVVENIGTKQGWSNPAPDEDFNTGYPNEMEAFYLTTAYGEPLESHSTLAADAISTIFSGYLSAEQDGKKIQIKTY